MGTPQAQNPIGVISRLMFFSIFPPKNENHPSLEVPEKRIFRTRKRGLQYKSQSYFVLVVSFFSSIECCCRLCAGRAHVGDPSGSRGCIPCTLRYCKIYRSRRLTDPRSEVHEPGPSVFYILKKKFDEIHSYLSSKMRASKLDGSNHPGIPPRQPHLGADERQG